MINKLDFSARNLTSSSGTLLLYEHAQGEGALDLLNEELNFERQSVENIKMNHIKTLLCGFFIGIDKLERIKLLQNDPLMNEMDISVRSPEAISRFLKNFNYRTTHELRKVNFKLFNKLLRQSKLQNIIIDIDSSVVNVEGNQEGVAKGYNPKKRGNNCYNIQFAFCDELKAYITGFIRSGNTHSANGASELIKEIYENIHYQGLNIHFRMDSGYFDEQIIKTIESLGCKYVIKAKAYRTLLSKVPTDEHFALGEYDRDTAELYTKMDKWKVNRRIVVSRVLKNDSSNQLSLFEKEYRYFFFITNDDSLTSDEVVIFYEKRGNCENYIKESK